jgi:hypothetical protein
MPLFQKLITRCGSQIGVEYEKGIFCQVLFLLSCQAIIPDGYERSVTTIPLSWE